MKLMGKEFEKIGSFWWSGNLKLSQAEVDDLIMGQNTISFGDWLEKENWRPCKKSPGYHEKMVLVVASSGGDAIRDSNDDEWGNTRQEILETAPTEELRKIWRSSIE